MKLKIVQHPQMRDIAIGDEVYCHSRHMFARVIETFPAAVCVRIGILSLQRTMELILSPQLWRADDIENLSICQYCGSRSNLHSQTFTGIPRRICDRCQQDQSR